MKVDLIELVTGLHGKMCSKAGQNAPIMAKNKVTGTQYAYHIHNPYTGAPTQSQTAGRQSFAAAAAAVKTAWADPAKKAALRVRFGNQTRCKTFWGYCFSLAYSGDLDD